MQHKHRELQSQVDSVHDHRMKVRYVILNSRIQLSYLAPNTGIYTYHMYLKEITNKTKTYIRCLRYLYKEMTAWYI